MVPDFLYNQFSSKRRHTKLVIIPAPVSGVHETRPGDPTSTFQALVGSGTTEPCKKLRATKSEPAPSWLDVVKTTEFPITLTDSEAPNWGQGAYYTLVKRTVVVCNLMHQSPEVLQLAAYHAQKSSRLSSCCVSSIGPLLYSPSVVEICRCFMDIQGLSFGSFNARFRKSADGDLLHAGVLPIRDCSHLWSWGCLHYSLLCALVPALELIIMLGHW